MNFYSKVCGGEQGVQTDRIKIYLEKRLKNLKNDLRVSFIPEPAKSLDGDSFCTLKYRNLSMKRMWLAAGHTDTHTNHTQARTLAKQQHRSESYNWKQCCCQLLIFQSRKTSQEQNFGCIFVRQERIFSIYVKQEDFQCVLGKQVRTAGENRFDFYLLRPAARLGHDHGTCRWKSCVSTLSAIYYYHLKH